MSLKEASKCRKFELEQMTVKKVKLEDYDDYTKSTTLNEECIPDGLTSFPKSLVNQLLSRPKLEQVDDLHISSILSKPSLRERFGLQTGDPLQSNRCKDLLSAFEVLDQRILFMRQRDTPTFFTTIQEQAGYELKLNQLQQILTVWDMAYSLSWCHNDKQGGRDDLMVKLPTSAAHEFSMRQRTFKEALLKHVLSHGDHVPEQALPTPNKVVMKPIVQSRVPPASHESRINLSKYKSLAIEEVGLSAGLLKKFRERQLQQVAPPPPKTIECDAAHLHKVASVISTYYVVRNVSNMFLKNVIQYVISHNRQYILDFAQVRKAIDLLLIRCPQWLSLVDNEQGTILRMNKNIEFSTIVSQIAL